MKTATRRRARGLASGFGWAGAATLLWLLAAAAGADSARYRVTFDAAWSAETHPEDFPPDPHFSPLVGGTHDAGVAFWEVGAPASDAVEAMAELGDPSPLTAEVEMAIVQGGAVTVISGGGIGTSPGSISTQFDITSSHPLVTLVSMIAPSPDWFVGVTGRSLRSGGSWIADLIVSLDPYDAGTDSGVTYSSPDDDTEPPEPISQITGFPFTGTPPLGTFHFELVKILGECEDLLDNDGDGLADHPADPGCDDPLDASERSPTLACDDGADNDDDGLVDFPADPGCQSPLDPSEAAASLPATGPPGLALTALLLAAAAAWRRPPQAARR